MGKSRERNGIGTLGEKTLHAVLKNYFEPYGENQEIRIGGYVADIVGENGVIEIQTRQFNKLLKKLEAFLDYCDVTVVYPIPAVKYVRWIDTETGELSEKHKSPRKYTIYEVMPELYKIKYTLDNPRFHLCLCMLETEEIRLLNGWSKNKKRGSSRHDRIPKGLIDEIHLDCPADFDMFLPEDLPKQFTSKDFALNAKISREYAQVTLNILTYLERVKRVGKQGANILYEKTE